MTIVLFIEIRKPTYYIHRQCNRQICLAPPNIPNPSLFRDRRFRELPSDELETLRVASEAEVAALIQAKEVAAKAAAKKAKKGAKKPAKGAKGAGAATPPTPEDAGEADVDPPSALEVYECVKGEVEAHRAKKKADIARQKEEEREVPTDPDGEAVIQEVCVCG